MFKINWLKNNYFRAAVVLIILSVLAFFGVREIIRPRSSLNCPKITCPDSESSGAGIPKPKSCPKSIPTLNLDNYINSIEPFNSGALLTLDKPSDKILSLVAIAENSSTDWVKQINYIEDINDKRGFTISLVGFCTGTGDFLQVVQRVAQLDSKHPLVKYLPALEAVNGSACHSGLDSLPSDIKALGTSDLIFNQAVFDLIKKLYWAPAIKYCADNNLSSNLCQYIAYDTLLNFGELAQFKDVNGSSEQEFLGNFLNQKECVIEACSNLGNPGKDLTGKSNRVDMQRSILQNQNLDLQAPMRLECYGDTFTL